MTDNPGLYNDTGDKSGHAKVANISPKYIVFQYADKEQVRYGGTKETKNFDMGEYWKEIYENGKNAKDALTQGPPTKGFTDEKGVHTWVDGEPSTEKPKEETDDEPSGEPSSEPSIDPVDVDEEPPETLKHHLDPKT